MVTDANSPALLKALQYILASPEDLHRSATDLLARLKSRNEGMTKQELQSRAAAKIISDASNLCGAVGAATALPGGVPGVGTAISMLGGGAADATLSLKFQVEMTMKLAVVYDHDVRSTNMQLLCLLLAGVGALQEFAKTGMKESGTKALTLLLKKILKGGLLQAVKVVFAKIGLTFSRKSVEKAIPGFVGVFLGFGVNKATTHLLGGKIRDWFASDTYSNSPMFA